ncbi:MAG TPA: glycosyltransferase [bacterium]|nr:glycosyltransferase [bacterium]
MIKTANLTSSLSRGAGGLFYSVRRLVQAIAAEGAIDVQVMALTDEFSDKDRAEWSPIRTQTFPTQGPKAFGYSSELSRALMHSEFELLHVHGMWMYPSHLSLRWGKKYKRPYMVSPHGMLDPWALKNSRWKKAVTNVLFQRENLERAACMRSLCVSETESVRLLGLKQPICQIPNGVDLPAPGPGGPAPWAKDLKPGSRVLYTIGRMHPKKGLPALIEAFSRVQKAGAKGSQDWVLVLAGWDQLGHEQHLKDLVKERGMEQKILFPGPLFGQAKADAFRASEAFVLPSFSEGLPVAVLEAWSYGLPVLMTPECNLPEGFAKGAAVKVATDADSLERSLTAYFAEDPEAHRAMGAKGRELVEAQFTWKRIGKDMSDTYLWLIHGGPKPDCVIL